MDDKETVDNPPAYKDVVVVVPIFDIENNCDSALDVHKLKEEENMKEFRGGKSDKSDQFCVCVLVVFILELILIICLLPILSEVIQQ